MIKEPLTKDSESFTFPPSIVSMPLNHAHSSEMSNDVMHSLDGWLRDWMGVAVSGREPDGTSVCSSCMGLNWTPS